MQPVRGEHFSLDGTDLNRAQTVPRLVAASRIAIFDFNKFPNGMSSIADDMRRHPSHGGNQAISHNQKTMRDSRNMPLDDDIRAIFTGGMKCDFDAGAGFEVQRYAISVVGIPRLDDDRQSQLARLAPCFFGCRDNDAGRHRRADRFQQRFGQHLVTRDALADVSGSVGRRQTDPPLADSLPQQDQTVGCESATGNSTLRRRSGEVGRACFQPYLLPQPAQPAAGRIARILR